MEDELPIISRQEVIEILQSISRSRSAHSMLTSRGASISLGRGNSYQLKFLALKPDIDCSAEANGGPERAERKTYVTSVIILFAAEHAGLHPHGSDYETDQSAFVLSVREGENLMKRFIDDIDAVLHASNEEQAQYVKDLSAALKEYDRSFERHEMNDVRTIIADPEYQGGIIPGHKVQKS